MRQAHISISATTLVATLCAFDSGCAADKCENTGTCGPSYVPPAGYCFYPDAAPELQLVPCPEAGADDGGGGMGGNDASTGGSDGGTDSDTPALADAEGDARPLDAEAGDAPSCSASVPGCNVGNWGIFVSPHGSTSGDGTKTKPVGSIGAALELAKANGKPVYACDDGTGFIEQLNVDSHIDGVVAYGGFNCSTWTYDLAARTLVRPATGAALTVKGLTTGATFERFELRSADAAAAGASSIAVIVDTAQNVVFRNSTIVAGRGGNGAAGADGLGGADGDSARGLLSGAAATCPGTVTKQNGGAWGGPSTCGSQGGEGGGATLGNDGAPGYSGNPRDAIVQPGNENRGLNGQTGSDGKEGATGLSGRVGTAAPANGSFGAQGYTPASPGGDGAGNGGVGQGGGGGGASDAPFGSTCIGASGGAGGMGGCGGKLGKGGASGGASLALLSWSSTVTLDACVLASANGGAGGKGGNGGLGGLGGDGAPGGDGFAGDAGPAIGKGGAGGKGGQGGMGGPGAGGNGGPSYAIVVKGQAPLQLGGTTATPGPGGAKGPGGIAGTLQAPSGVLGDSQPTFLIQ